MPTEHPLFMLFVFANPEMAAGFYEAIVNTATEENRAKFFCEQDNNEITVTAVTDDEAWNHAFYMACCKHSENYMQQARYGMFSSIGQKAATREISIHDGDIKHATSVRLACIGAKCSGISFRGESSQEFEQNYEDNIIKLSEYR